MPVDMVTTQHKDTSINTTKTNPTPPPKSSLTEKELAEVTQFCWLMKMEKRER